MTETETTNTRSNIMMMTKDKALAAAIASAPAHTSGLVVAPWDSSEAYGVAADWAEASAPVWYYGDREWVQTGEQVADYRHDPRSALMQHLIQASDEGGTSPEPVGRFVDDATAF